MYVPKSSPQVKTGKVHKLEVDMYLDGNVFMFRINKRAGCRRNDPQFRIFEELPDLSNVSQGLPDHWRKKTKGGEPPRDSTDLWVENRKKTIQNKKK